MVTQFGSGVVFMVPILGNLPTNPSPQKVGILQEATVDFKADLKKLYGQYQVPLATARGKLDVTVKGKMAIFDVNFLNQVYFGLSTTSGYNKVVTNEQHTINANVTTATNIPLVQDFGVIYYATGAAFTKVANVASITANGQYVVNLTSGVYTFNGGDNASVVLLSYTYNVNAGASVVISEQLMGYAPEVQLFLFNNFRNKYLALQLNDVTLGSISIPTKLEDFWIADFDGSANADASGNLGIWMSDLS